MQAAALVSSTRPFFPCLARLVSPLAIALLLAACGGREVERSTAGEPDSATFADAGAAPEAAAVETAADATGATAGGLGAACGTCDEGLSCLKEERVPEGFCTRSCMEGDTCGGGGAFCLVEESLCIPPCDPGGSCRAGLHCVKYAGTSGCIPLSAPDPLGAVGDRSCIDLGTLLGWWHADCGGARCDSARLDDDGTLVWYRYDASGKPVQSTGGWRLDCPSLQVFVDQGEAAGVQLALTVRGGEVWDGPNRWVRCGESEVDGCY